VKILLDGLGCRQVRFLDRSDQGQDCAMLPAASPVQ